MLNNDFNNEIKEPQFKIPQFINNYDINSKNPIIKNDNITLNENYYCDNINIGCINLTLAKSNKKIKHFNRTNYINTPLIPFSPENLIL